MKLRCIIAIIAILMLVLAGCGGKEPEGQCPATCDDGNPCTQDACGADTGFMCRNIPIPGCSADCGMPCVGPVGQYMEMQCDPVMKQCASDAKAGLQTSITTMTREATNLGNKFKITPVFITPFNIKKELFNVQIEISQFGTGVQDATIKSIEISGLDANRQMLVIGKKDVNKPVWTAGDTLDENVILEFPTTANDGIFSNLKITVNYEFRQMVGLQLQTKTGTVPLQLVGTSIAWFKPSRTQACPASCDDGNEGTADKCSAATDYFCENEPIPGKCGNYECDIGAGENKCTCPMDCGPCEGDAGKNLAYVCQADECRTMVKPGVVQQPTPKTDDRNLGPVYFQNTYTYNNPFNVKTDDFQLEFKLYNKQDAVGAVKITEARVLEGTTALGTLNIDKTLNSIGSTATANLPITSFAGDEAEKTVSLKFYVEYQLTTTAGTELKKIDFSVPIGKITLINPTIQ